MIQALSTVLSLKTELSRESLTQDIFKDISVKAAIRDFQELLLAWSTDRKNEE